MTRSRHFIQFEPTGEMTLSRHLWRSRSSATNDAIASYQPIEACGGTDAIASFVAHRAPTSMFSREFFKIPQSSPYSLPPLHRPFSAQRKLLSKQAMLTQPNLSLTSFGISGLNYPSYCRERAETSQPEFHEMF